MKLDPRLIISGWFNLTLDKFNMLDQQTKDMAAERFSFCDTCKIRDGKICSPERSLDHVVTKQKTPGCGCVLSAKVMSKDSKCPIGLW